MKKLSCIGIYFLIIACLFILVFGCVALSQNKDDLIIGYSAIFLADPFQVAQQQQILLEAERQGIKYLPPTNANQDAEKQITDIRTLVSRGANVIIATPVDTKAFMAAIAYCSSQNVPVICIDMPPEEPGAYITVRANNIYMSSIAAQWVAEKLNKKGKVLELQGNLTQGNGRDRHEGFTTTMTEEYPDIEVIGRPTQWLNEKAADATQTVLSSNPDVGAIFMPSNACALPGVLKSLELMNLDKLVGEDGHIYLIGIDGTPYDHDMIRDRKLDAAVSQPLLNYAKLGIKYAVDAHAGIEVKLGSTDHNSEIIIQKGIIQDLLPSTIVTLENVEDPELWGNMVQGY